MELLFIRHGQSVGNLEERLQGQAEYPLTQKGRDQAQALAQRLRRENRSIAAIYASDQSRAVNTAEILSAELGAPLHLDARLREYDAGELNGIVFQEMETRYPELWHAWRTSPEWVPFPGSEGTASFHARLSASLADIQDRHGDGEVVVVVSHGGSLGMILAHLLRMDVNRPTPFFFGNASLSIVQLTPRGPRLSLMNDTSHLDGESD
jgi:probable phosphoglycerate mutase